MNLLKSLSWICALALALLVPIGSAHEKVRQPSSEWMQVVEPRAKSGLPPLNETIRHEGYLSSLPAMHANVEAPLTPEEVSKALFMRVEAQRALREFKAKKMAQNRRKGKAAWNRELENFLSSQRQIEREQTNLKKEPNSKQELEKKFPNTDRIPVRKGRSVFT